MKKLVSIFMTVTLLVTIVFGQATFAMGTDNDNIKDRARMYGLKEVEELPEGVTPIKINSVKELDEVMHRLKSSNNMMSSHGSEFNSNIDKNAFSSIKTASTDLYNDTTYYRADIMGAFVGAIAKLSLEVNYDYYAEGSFYGIEDIRYDRWVLSGMDTGLSLSNEEIDSKLDNGVIDVVGSVDVDCYLLVEGSIKVWSDTYRAGYKYSLEKEYFDDYFEKN